MGQKVNPYGFRLGVTTDWKSRWFADRDEYSDNVIQDWKIRDYLMSELPHAAISRVEIERKGHDRHRFETARGKGQKCQREGQSRHGRSNCGTGGGDCQRDHEARKAVGQRMFELGKAEMGETRADHDAEHHIGHDQEPWRRRPLHDPGQS